MPTVTTTLKTILETDNLPESLALTILKKLLEALNNDSNVKQNLTYRIGIDCDNIAVVYDEDDLEATAVSLGSRFTLGKDTETLPSICDILAGSYIKRSAETMGTAMAQQLINSKEVEKTQLINTYVAQLPAWLDLEIKKIKNETLDIRHFDSPVKITRKTVIALPLQILHEPCQKYFNTEDYSKSSPDSKSMKTIREKMNQRIAAWKKQNPSANSIELKNAIKETLSITIKDLTQILFNLPEAKDRQIVYLVLSGRDPQVEHTRKPGHKPLIKAIAEAVQQANPNVAATNAKKFTENNPDIVNNALQKIQQGGEWQPVLATSTLSH